MTDTGRSGGKILKSRRTATRTTPYDRPQQPPPPPPPPENPNWLTGLVSPAKFVAGGATKILSSFWNPVSWAGSSSSEEEEETDSGSEDESGDDDAVDELNQQQQGSLSQKTKTLHLIEQLLMLEQFTREEGDRLIEIIKSRVLDYPMTEGGDAGPSTILNTTYDENPDIRSRAIKEAKKLIEDNKIKSSLKSNMDNGLHALKSAVTPQIIQTTEGDAGSPVDVAKSYMKARPPWASPIIHDTSPTPSPLATPYSGVGTSFSSAKRDYLSAGSWNIQEEIRRVRTKATEDMLSSHRSMKHGPSTSEYNTAKKFSLLNDKYVVVGRDEAINFGTPKPVTEIVTIDSDEGSPDLSDMRAAQDELPTEKQTTRNSNDLVEKNCYLMTESPDIPPINFSQGSSNNDDHSLATKTDDTSENRAVTRSGRNTRRGRGRGK